MFLILAAAMLIEFGDVPPPDTSFTKYAKAHGLAKSFVYVVENPGSWKVLGLVYDSVFVWMPEMSLARDCGPDTIYADKVFAMTEPMENKIVWLKGRVVLGRHGLWRRPYGGRRATIIFARFPKCREEK